MNNTELIDRIRAEVINSDISSTDLRIVLDIFRKIGEETQQKQEAAYDAIYTES